MQFNIPLIPVSVEVRWRPLAPLRTSTWGLMLAVFWAALVFAAIGEARRLSEAASYHAIETVKASTARSNAPAAGPTELEHWHQAKAMAYRVALERADFLAFVLVVATLVVGLTAVVGWTIHRCYRTRTGMTPSGDAQPQIALVAGESR